MVIGVVAAVLVLPHDAGAIGDGDFQNPEESASGVPSPASLWMLGPFERGGPRWFAGAGEQQLHAGTGLRVSQLRAGIRGRRMGVVAFGDALTSPVGRELLGRVHVFRQTTNNVIVSVGLGASTVHLAQLRASRLMTASAAMMAHFAGVDLGYEADGVRLAGEDVSGANLTAYARATPPGPAAVCAGVRMRRDGGWTLRMALQASVGPLRLSVGYDDAPHVLRGALRIHRHRVTVLAGGAIHPVLGVSTGVAVAWMGGTP